MAVPNSNNYSTAHTNDSTKQLQFTAYEANQKVNVHKCAMYTVYS